MKKSLIALAVTSVVALPLSVSAMGDDKAPWYDGTEVYGSLRTQIVSQDGLSVNNGTSRWGVKGGHDMGNGLTGVYRMEYGVDTAGAKTNMVSRLGYVGLSGGFGTVALGEQWTPYYNIVAAPSDVFTSVGIPFSPTPFRAGNVLAYALPGGSAVNGAIALVMNGKASTRDGIIPVVSDTGDVIGGIPVTGSVADDDDIDAINGAFSFAAGPVTVGLGWHDVEGAGHTLVGLNVAANFGDVGVSVLYEDAGDTNPYALTATYGGFAAQISDNDAGADGWALGYSHALAPKVKVSLDFEDTDLQEDLKAIARLRVDF